MRDNRLFEYSPVDEDAFNASTLNNLEDFTKDNFLACVSKTPHRNIREQTEKIIKLWLCKIAW
jgi:hypothetical protein